MKGCHEPVIEQDIRGVLHQKGALKRWDPWALVKQVHLKDHPLGPPVDAFIAQTFLTCSHQSPGTNLMVNAVLDKSHITHNALIQSPFSPFFIKDFPVVDMSQS